MPAEWILWLGLKTPSSSQSPETRGANNALAADKAVNETHIWAPHVLRDEANSRWVMAFQTGLAPDFGNQFLQKLKIAVSTDLCTEWVWPSKTSATRETPIC